MDFNFTNIYVANFTEVHGRKNELRNFNGSNKRSVLETASKEPHPSYRYIDVSIQWRKF